MAAKAILESSSNSMEKADPFPFFGIVRTNSSYAPVINIGTLNCLGNLSDQEKPNGVKMKKLLKWISVPSLIVLFAMPSWGIRTRHDRADQQYIDFGTQFGFVCKFRYTPRPQPTPHPTAILLANGWVITAGHNLSTYGVDGIVGKWITFNPTNTLLGEVDYQIAEASLHIWLDMALLRLATVPAITPVEINTVPVALNTDMVEVGYGGHLSGLNPGFQIDDYRRAATNKLDIELRYNGVFKAVTADFDSPGTPGITDLEGGYDYNDSGCAVLIPSGNSYKLARVSPTTSYKIYYSHPTNLEDVTEVYDKSPWFHDGPAHFWTMDVMNGNGPMLGVFPSFQVGYHPPLPEEELAESFTYARPESLSPLPMKIEVLEPTTGTVMDDSSVSLLTDGSWYCTTIVTGSHDIRFKPQCFLSRRLNGFNLRSIGTVINFPNEPGTDPNGFPASMFICGDLNDDNEIATDDYLMFSDSFDSSPGLSNWNVFADFDRNGVINSDDYIIFSRNFGLAGD